MREIFISDETMKRSAAARDFALTFKQKLELAKLLDGAGVSVVEVEGIENPKVDYLRVKSIASVVKNSVLAVPVRLDGSDIDLVWKALAEANKPRLQVQVSTSPARMEFIHKRKAPQLIEEVAATVKACAALTSDVEFIADDATRTDPEYLATIISAAIEAGATTITVCDDAGTMLPYEFAQFVRELRASVSGLDQVALGISCSNGLFVAESNAIAGIMEGVAEIKVTSYPFGTVALDKVCKIISDKGDTFGICCSIRTTALKRTMTQIQRICEQGVGHAVFAAGAADDAAADMVLGEHDSQEDVAQCVAKLGYDLSGEDMALVYESFMRIASKKGSITGRELDAIVATAAMQVPETYKLVRYTLNSGNCIKASACIQMSVRGEMVEKVALGDGPIDAAFAAIDEIVGKTYELDDWQMQSVTEGQKAMGEAVIKLISEGKIYSGRGLSTDILGSSIRAYINALNKAVYEEEN